jgi:hypothetical protein
MGGNRSRLVVTVTITINELDGYRDVWYSTIPKQSRLQKELIVNWIETEVSICWVRFSLSPLVHAQARRYDGCLDVINSGKRQDQGHASNKTGSRRVD